MSRHLSTAAPAGCRAALWSSGGCWAAGGWSGRRWWMAGGLCCRLADAGLSGCRRCKEGGPAAGGGGAVGGVQCGGEMVCRWWPSGWPAWRLLVVCRGWLGGGDPAEVCGGDSVIFNQLLTTFLVVAMVWRLTVFWLCSKGYSRRALPGR